MDGCLLLCHCNTTPQPVTPAAVQALQDLSGGRSSEPAQADDTPAASYPSTASLLRIAIGRVPKNGVKMVQWVKLKQEGASPGPRSSHAAAGMGNKLYVFGGELEPRKPVDNALYCYDFVTNSWTKLQASDATPQPRNACTMTSIGNNLYVFGGRTGMDMGEGSLSDLYVFDTGTSEWSRAEAGSPPPARSYHTMTAAGSKIYVFGGCGANGRLNDLHEFDPATASWQLPSADNVNPRGGSVLVSSLDGSKLYVLGGFSGKELDDCHCFDLNSQTWSCPCCTSTAAKDLNHTAWTMPLARSVFGACALNHATSCSSSSSSGDHDHHAGHILAFGGEVDPSAQGHSGAGQFTAAVTCFDPVNASTKTTAAAAENSSSSSWHGVVPSGEGPCPRGWFAWAAVDGGFLLHGGLDCNNQRLEDMYLLKTCA